MIHFMTLKIEAIYTYEILVSTYRSTWHHNSDDNNRIIKVHNEIITGTG
jgi:hypothetical protein